jgi:hypothetical protein
MEVIVKFRHGLCKTMSAGERTLLLLLRLPFDLAREQYANAVRLGLIKRSLLAWAKFEQTLGSLENLALGPWARRV